MGRTNPTYRRYLEGQREQLADFRRALRRDSKADFDRVLTHADQYADAAGYLNHTDPETAMLLSMVVGLEADRRALARRVEELETHVSPDG